MPEPVPFYPEMPCHLAPLKEKVAPLEGCACKVCKWLRGEPPEEPPSLLAVSESLVNNAAALGDWAIRGLIEKLA